MRLHNHFISILLCASAILAASNAAAEPLLLTISDTDSGQTETWWPNKAVSDSPWFPLLERQGNALIQPSTNAPRLSPAVYAPVPLSNANAKTLASLFGTHTVLNGNTTWNCQNIQNLTECTARFNGHLILAKNEIPLSGTATAAAETSEMAKTLARNQIAVELTSKVMAASQNSANGDIPNLISKPMIIFSSLPDADTLVQLRKTLKTIPGVEDVAERWIADNALAIELNPAQSAISESDFSRIVQELANQSIENLIIRHTRSTPQGAVFEIVKY